MEKTKYSRKMDASGRLIVPSELRTELKMGPGDLYEFYLHEHEGDTYLCVCCTGLIDPIEQAKRVLREAGIAVD